MGRHALCVTGNSDETEAIGWYILDFVSLDLVKCQPLALEIRDLECFPPNLVMLNPTTLLVLTEVDTYVVDVDERVLGPEYIPAMATEYI
ncbi:hypothetical protein KIPB_013328 [Kipferlia bialata]|uniref:Uncharacterized protein n=1 Tax=Kipferlia bialata TaxID=797122 RepID=A0A391NUA7_9EUKA|nr:hypothetical protein KIPB_013328 [Kipferlia bialata]|eukprot:g13328.t1